MFAVDYYSAFHKIGREKRHCGASKRELPSNLSPGHLSLDPQQVQYPGLIDSLDIIRPHHGIATFQPTLLYISWAPSDKKWLAAAWNAPAP